MPNSIFSRKSSTASKTSRRRKEEYNLLNESVKNIARRLLICYKSLCCFPLDQILPPNLRRNRNGLNVNPKSGLCQTSEKVLNDIKIVNILPRSRVSFSKPARVKSEICSRKLVSSISKAKKVKSEISSTKKLKNDISDAKILNSRVSLIKIKELPTDKFKLKLTKARMFKEKGKKIFDYGSGRIRNTFRYKTKMSGVWRNAERKSKNNVRGENKKMVKISNPSSLKWKTHVPRKPQEVLTTSSTDNEESSGDGPETPKIPCINNKIPLPRKNNTDLFQKVDKQVTLQII